MIRVAKRFCAGLGADRNRRERQSAALVPRPAPVNTSLQALTVAALALPGLGHAAEGDEAGVQYGHYQEGGGTHSRFRESGNSIGVETLQAFASARLMDRIRLLFNYTQDTWSGATPIASAPASSLTPVDNIVGASKFWEISTPVTKFDPTRGVGVVVDPETRQRYLSSETVEIMAMASPETRKQGDFRLGYEWDEAAVDGGGGVSIENDFDVWFLNLGGRWDFNQKRTTLTAGTSYTNSFIHANRFAYSAVGSQAPNPSTVHGTRQDESFGLGLVQVLDKKSMLDVSVGYTNSTGYLSNPYKQSLFFAPIDAPQLNSPNPQTGLYSSLAVAEFDNRPRVRDQINFNTRYVRYFDSVDGALHANYRFYHDGWGINAHTFEASWGQPVGSGWVIRPRVRYYTQGAAHFYSAFFVLNQTLSFEDYLNVAVKEDASGLQLPSHWSSDYRLSGFGTLSGGLTFTKQFARGIRFQGGIEYYTHSGAMKLGGGGEGNFANFNFWLVNAAVAVDLSARAKRMEGEDELDARAAESAHEHHAGHESHGGHAGHHGSPFPAGVMFANMMQKPDDLMVGYRYMWVPQAGNFLHGSHPVGDADIVANGCAGVIECFLAPREMNMHMHMLDIMYAPTDWLNLMLMPMFMDMNMQFRQLEGAEPPSGHSGHTNHLNRTQSSGGWGDTGFYALGKLFDVPNHHMHVTLGFTAPTGSTTQRVSGGDYTHYGMQLGSGTWDFRPSLTYTGYLDRFSWGAQVSGIARGDTHNEEGYRLGDQFQSTAWGSYQVLESLSANIRGMYTWQGRIAGAYKNSFTPIGPMDFPTNYGGRFWDIGFGLNVDIKHGELQGNSLSVEWLQPVESDVNGYQLKPAGMLSATWTLMF